ncbi:MAG: SusC/RagA family TonB-linked outer membrane protein, partial [Chitinophagaceae bacterium]|nr:SusC/RagA family TonB-linked outer membrane protein [Chitinophagaceae bacterium]
MKKQLTRGVWSSLLALFLLVGSAYAQKTVSGKVTDANGVPVTGASVTVKGGTQGTSTDMNGAFTLSVPADGKMLVISAVGYATRELEVEGTDFSNISLTNKANDLNEVVVIGYGTARKKDLTGSVAQVQAKDFNKGVFAAPDALIQGKVAGVQIIQNSGAPGAGSTIRIRGNASVRAGTQPLFVVDGVPLDGGSPRPGVNNELGATPGGNPLNFINPADIASMEVLKDASAAAIYGSRGANGVVIITTKKGQSGEPKVEFGVSTGFSSILRRMEILDAAGYRDALRKYNLTTGDLGGNSDPLGSILRTGITQNYNMSISGGNADAKYRVSLGYLDQEGIIRKTDFKKLAATINSSFRFLKSKKLGLDINIISSQNIENIAPVSNNAGFQGSLIGQALQWNPTRNLRNSDGSLVIDNGGAQVNPLAMSEAYDDKSIITNILGSISPSYKITNALEFRMLYSINYGTGTRRTQIGRNINLQNIQNRGWANYANNELITNQLTNTLTFNKKITNDLNLNAVAGYEYMKFVNRGAGVSGQDFIDVGIPYTSMLQFTTQGTRGVGSFAPPVSELQSYFGRAILNFRDKYVFTATFRADGSSKFGENNKYGYFPSFAASWNVGEEDFLRNSNLFSSLKLRASWGQ